MDKLTTKGEPERDWQEELRQSVLTTLNLFAMAIEADGYTSELHEIYTNRILEDTQEAVEAERKRYKEWVEYEVIGQYGGSNPEERKRMRTRLDDYDSIIKEAVKGK